MLEIVRSLTQPQQSPRLRMASISTEPLTNVKEENENAKVTELEAKGDERNVHWDDNETFNVMFGTPDTIVHLGVPNCTFCL